MTVRKQLNEARKNDGPLPNLDKIAIESCRVSICADSLETLDDVLILRLVDLFLATTGGSNTGSLGQTGCGWAGWLCLSLSAGVSGAGWGLGGRL